MELQLTVHDCPRLSTVAARQLDKNVAGDVLMTRAPALGKMLGNIDTMRSTNMVHPGRALYALSVVCAHHMSLRAQCLNSSCMNGCLWQHPGTGGAGISGWRFEGVTGRDKGQFSSHYPPYRPSENSPKSVSHIQLTQCHHIPYTHLAGQE